MITQEIDLKNQEQINLDSNKSSIEEQVVVVKSYQTSTFEQIQHNYFPNNEEQLTFYNRSRQLSVQNPTAKNTLEFPKINAIANTKHNFYNDNLSNQFTQPEIPKKQTIPKYRNQRSTSFNEGSNFYQEQSKTCEISMQSNGLNDVQNKFFKYFKTQIRIRKDSLKQLSQSHSDNKSIVSNNLQKNGNESKNSLYQNSEDYPRISDTKDSLIQNNTNNEIADQRKNYLYEEGLDTIQDQEEVNTQCYFELYKNGNKNNLPPKKNNFNIKNCNNPKKISQNELFLQGDISPWHNNQRVYHLLQAGDKKKEGRSISSSVTPNQQNQIWFNKETDRSHNLQIANQGTNIIGLQGSESNMSILNCYNNQENKAQPNQVYLNTKSQLLSDPHQHIKQLQTINNKSNENKLQENKEVYNFSKRNSKQLQNNTLKIQLKSCGQTESVLGEIQNKQQPQQALIIQKIKENQEVPINPIYTPIPQVATPIIVDMNPLSGKENMPKFYNNLANTETKKSVFPKIQQFNLYKPNTIIFQSNQKYKSQFDNSSNNFNECITFLPKNLKNKILKQLEK